MLAQSQLLGTIDNKDIDLDNHKGLRRNQELGKLIDKAHLLHETSLSRPGKWLFYLFTFSFFSIYFYLLKANYFTVW